MGWRGARFRRFYLAYGIPSAVLILGLLFTAYVTQTLRQIDEARNQERFSELVSEAHNTIEARLSTYIALLRAGAGFYTQSDGMTGDQFRRFVQHLRLEESYRGIQGFGFSQRVRPDELASFVARRRAEGPTDFRIWPDTARDEYHVVKYLEPLEDRNRRALGFDMFTEATREEAMQRARDTGAPAASGKVELVPEITGRREAGFVIYLPVYEGDPVPESVAERRERLVGFMYSPFRAGDLFRSILSESVIEEIAFRVYDGDPAPENLLYSSFTGPDGIEPAFSAVRPLGFAGRKWTIDYRSLPSFEAGARSPTLDIMPFIGIIFSILLAAIAAGQVQARIAAQRETRERRRAEAAVAEREQQLRRVLDSIFAFIGVLDPQGRILEVNRAPLEATGLEREALIGQTFWTTPWWSGDDGAQEAIRSAVERAAAGEVIRQDVPLRLGDDIRTLDLQIAPLNDAEGNVSYLLPFGVDVTDRREAEDHQATLMAELSHRVKNSLAVIQSLARQTGARAQSVPEFMEAFQGRLSALAAAHSLLVDTGWHTARLDSVIRLALKPHLVRETEQLVLNAQPISVSPELAQNMALIVHELATNAVKYGALASAGGHISVEADVQDDMLVLVWREQRPGVIEPPGEAGFGTTLLKALVAGRHHGEVQIDWAANGLVCTIRIPASELSAQPDRRNVFAEHSAAPEPGRERVAS